MLLTLTRYMSLLQSRDSLVTEKEMYSIMYQISFNSAGCMRITRWGLYVCRGVCLALLDLLCFLLLCTVIQWNFPPTVPRPRPYPEIHAHIATRTGSEGTAPISNSNHMGCCCITSCAFSECCFSYEPWEGHYQ